MAVIGFNFSRINVERKEAAKGKINVSNNVSITNIEQTSIPLGKEKQNVLRFSFEFTSKFDPDIGNIILGGNLLFLEDDKKIKEIHTNWKKDKSVPKDIMSGILNTVLSRCNIQALILSQEVNLPPPVPLPKVRVEAPENKSYIQ